MVISRREALLLRLMQLTETVALDRLQKVRKIG
jgi:hypothetical protein